LLIVGGLDEVVLDLNREAYAQLNTEKYLAVVAGATHLFEEAGALQEVARLAAEWFKRYLRRDRRLSDMRLRSWAEDLEGACGIGLPRDSSLTDAFIGIGISVIRRPTAVTINTSSGNRTRE
jgi:hypothetical protein